MDHNTPLAAQLLRKTQRLSIAGASRSSIGMRASNLFETNKRRSTLLTTPASTKRQSIYGIFGSATQGSSQSVYGSQSSQQNSQNVFPPADRKDARPLRDKKYRKMIQEEIFAFLVANDFETAMNHTITPTTLVKPTQKDFKLIFQFLYKKIDPNYVFTRLIDNEVFTLLKLLNYPYLDGINRSSLSAVGGQTCWPAFLAMLYWLVKLNLSLLYLEPDQLVSPDDIFDRIFIKYIVDSYRAFRVKEEDYSEFYNQMRESFDLANEEVVLAAEDKKKAGKVLQAEFEELNKKYTELEEAEKKSHALEEDLKNFSKFLESIEQRRSTWAGRLQEMQKELELEESKILELNAKKIELEDSLKAKGLSIAEIDKQSAAREKLEKQIELIDNKISDLEDKIATKENDLKRSFQSLLNFIGLYNTMALRITTKDTQLFRLKLEFEVDNDAVGYEPEQILDKSLQEEKKSLLKAKDEVNEEIRQTQDEVIKIVEQVDSYSEKIFSEQEKLESLEAQINKNKFTLDELFENLTADSLLYSAQLEKQDRQIQAMLLKANKGIIEAKTRHQNLVISYREHQRQITEKQKELHDKVERLINISLLFKVNVQSNLEELDKLAQQELDKEQGTHSPPDIPQADA